MEYTTDIFGQNTMYEIHYKYGRPDGKVRTTSEWTTAKDENDARKQAEQKLSTYGYKWFKITGIKKIS